MTFTVEFSAEGRKDFKRLDESRKRLIAARIEELASNPYDPRISDRLESLEGLRKSRVGDRRIIFVVNQTARVIEVVTIRPRGQAYRKLRRKL